MISLLLLLALCPPGMAQIEGGPAILGVDPPLQQRWHEPRSMRELAPYCIDRYEHPNREGAFPTVGIEWDRAQAACAEQGKRLCTSDEWERACRGTAGWHYSYGPEFDIQTCNTPIVGDGPGSEDIPYARSGAHPDCHSPEGVFDLNGNVGEWVADGWDFERLGPGGGPGDSEASLRQLRGGTMWNGTWYGQSCVSLHAHPRQAQSDDDGFRCCLSLGATGGASSEGARATTAMWIALALGVALALAGGAGLVVRRRQRGAS